MAKFEEEEEEYEEDIPCQISPVFTPDGNYRRLRQQQLVCLNISY